MDRIWYSLLVGLVALLISEYRVISLKEKSVGFQMGPGIWCIPCCILLWTKNLG